MNDRLFVMKPPKFMNDTFPEEMTKLLSEGEVTHQDSFGTPEENKQTTSHLDVEITDIRERVELYEEWLKYIGGLPDNSPVKLAFKSMDQYDVDEAFANVKDAIDRGVIPPPDGYTPKPVKSEELPTTAVQVTDMTRRRYNYNASLIQELLDASKASGKPVDDIDLQLSVIEENLEDAGGLPEYNISEFESQEYKHHSAIDVAKECAQKESTGGYCNFIMNRFTKKQ